MRIKVSQLRSLIREEIENVRRLPVVQDEPTSCPAATQDLRLNTMNRNKAIMAKHIQYGPLNMADEEYWERIAEHWNTTVDVAKESTCGSCGAFDVSPRMIDCMPGEIMPREEIAAALDRGEPWQSLGYCWMHHFKCHSMRSCYTWAAGGPIMDDKTSSSWEKNS
jgi:hypothetical protein